MEKIVKASDVFETAPWGVTEQPFFLNACITFETNIEPLALLKTVKLIEAEMGRKENIRWGARLIDIDILLIDDLQLELPELTIPHLSMAQRDFVLVPLAQILPDWRHPKNELSIAEMTSALTSEPPLKICALLLS